MITTIDSGGRVVIPKVVRQAMGLSPGERVVITARDGRIEIEVATTPAALELRGGLLVAVPKEPVSCPLTQDQVRDVLEQVRP
ncbi:MAG: AbrB/MazE/SpoVT family DNA-binding domain-containing protein [Acidimicrobiales bacterium]